MALYNALPKGDSHLKYKIYIEKVIRNIMNKHNLLSFFSIIETHMSIFFMMFKKKIAGKNLLIPLSVNKSQRLNIISRLIISSLKLRMEQTFVDKLTAELLDIHNKKGLTITKRLNYVKQMKDNLSNIRFLNEKY
jgi:ribosomal protein S7